MPVVRAQQGKSCLREQDRQTADLLVVAYSGDCLYLYMHISLKKTKRESWESILKKEEAEMLRKSQVDNRGNLSQSLAHPSAGDCGHRKTSPHVPSRNLQQQAQKLIKSPPSS